MIEGIYALEQWWIGDVVHVPPHVEGRFILREGTVLAFLHNRSAMVPRYSGTLFGRYRLDANTFSYGYDDALMVSHSAEGIGIGEQAPWQGMREFSVQPQPDAMLVRSEGGAEEFRFAADGFLYSENGRPVRRWRRLGGPPD
jgi:hypothetical protein